MRTLKYKDAISEGLVQAMEADENIFVIGISVNYSSKVFGTTKEAAERFPDRVITTPAMENALTGICIGAAAMGKRPVIVHDRADFSFLAMDQLINLAAKWQYMFGGNAGSVPVVTRMIIGKGWGQGATHSQALHSLYGHFPGLQVAIPGSPWTAYDVMRHALRSNNPTVILEHRALYEVEQEMAFGTLGPSNPGGNLYHTSDTPDITIAGVGYLYQEAKAAADLLAAHNIFASVIDPCWVRPYDSTAGSIDAVVGSVRMTGRLLVADCSHETCGFASEICATVAEKAFAALKAAPRRLTLPDCPTPTAKSLEDAFYPTASTIVRVVLDMLGREVPKGLSAIDRVDGFKGPY